MAKNVRDYKGNHSELDEGNTESTPISKKRPHKE